MRLRPRPFDALRAFAIFGFFSTGAGGGGVARVEALRVSRLVVATGGGVLLTPCAAARGGLRLGDATRIEALREVFELQ